MFEITKTAAGLARLRSEQRLSAEDFRAIAGSSGLHAFAARKSGAVAARRCNEPTIVETHWNGTETRNTAQTGDYILTSLDEGGRPMLDGNGERNVYVVAADRFATLYAPTGATSADGDIFRATASVEAVYFPGGIDIVAPWGERQHADDGYLLLNGVDVYVNHAETFRNSYRSI